MNNRIERLILVGFLLITIVEGFFYTLGQVQMHLPIIYR